ncbi:hypothetical protein R1flu_021603 [Riccia fluitans]|uniref:Uncharacterized protein n=1 Tax=Riccia fluitans TaxID=41844 RepID=A0ABD1ZPV7_9MARC
MFATLEMWRYAEPWSGGDTVGLMWWVEDFDAFTMLLENGVREVEEVLMDARLRSWETPEEHRGDFRDRLSVPLVF